MQTRRTAAGGRPVKIKNPRRIVLLVDEETEIRIDDFRAAHRPILTLSEAVRILIEKATKS